MLRRRFRFRPRVRVPVIHGAIHRVAPDLKVVASAESLEERQMLTGTFDNGEFNFCVSVRFQATDEELQQIRDAFTAGSQILADATDGQHRFGTITIVNDSRASAAAEYWVHRGEGRANAIINGYGKRGQHVNLYFDSDINGGTGGAYTIAHEHAHHAYGIYDEYSGPNDPDGILPIGDPNKAENAPRPDVATLNYSLMDNFFIRGGRANGGSTYTLNEFSVAANHDPDMDTWQSVRNGVSDWETIAASRYPATPPVGLPVDLPPAPHTVTFVDGNGSLGVMMLLDRSGSMGGNQRLDFAKLGAKAFTQSFQTGDSLGIASFSSTSRLETPLTEITGPAVIHDADAAIDALVAGGSTNIGGGLQTSLAEFTGTHSSSCNNVIVLLSDGDHNTGTDPISVIPDLQAAGITVFTVGVGRNISTFGQQTLQQIALETGGVYTTLRNSADQLNVLQAIAQQSMGNGILARAPLTLTQNDTASIAVPVETGAESTLFFVAIEDASDDITVQLTSPSGRIITETSGETDVVIKTSPNGRSFEVSTPEGGEWQVGLISGAVASGRVVVQAFAQNDGTDLFVQVENPVVNYPEPIRIVATPQYQGHKLIGATVTGTVTGPAGAPVAVTLYDDGLPEHGDAIANDGIYSALHTVTAGSGDGTYNIDLMVQNASGQVHPGESLYSHHPANNIAVPVLTRLGSTAAVVSGVPDMPSVTNAVQGRKWHDVNRNGQWDSGENYLNGWNIELVDAVGTIVATAVTSDLDLDGDGLPETGAYRFDGLPEGDYTVREVLPPGWKQSAPVATAAQAAWDLDQALNLRQTQNDFRDWGGLDERWLATDTGWAFITPDGTLYAWNPDSTQLTGDVLGRLTPAYHADLALLAEAQEPQLVSVTITPGAPPVTVDFGNYIPSQISGRKWEDADANGVWDQGEAWLNGWTIELLNATNGTVLDTTTTQDIDLNGDGVIDPQRERGVYRFSGLLPGEYEVREVQRAGWVSSAPDASIMTLANQLNADLGLMQTQNDFLNWGGLSERWLRGNSGWYFMTPDGTLYEWDGSSRASLTGTVVGTLNAAFYQDLSLLTDPPASGNRFVVTDEDIFTDVNFGNYRLDGLHGIEQLGTAAAGRVPGNVTTRRTGRNYFVQGDGDDNQVAIVTNAAGDVVVVGLHGTTVNGSAVPAVLLQHGSEFPGHLVVQMYGGHDFVHIGDLSTADHLQVSLGNGDDVASLRNVSTGGNLSIAGGGGKSIVALSGVQVSNNLRLTTSHLNDVVLVSDVVVSNNTSVYTYGGSDFVYVANSTFHDNAVVHTGAGNDAAVVRGQSILRRLGVLNGGAGTDSLDVEDGVDTSTLRTFVRSVEQDSVDASLLDAAMALIGDYGVDF